MYYSKDQNKHISNLRRKKERKKERKNERKIERKKEKKEFWFTLPSGDGQWWGKLWSFCWLKVAAWAGTADETRGESCQSTPTGSPCDSWWSVNNMTD